MDELPFDGKARGSFRSGGYIDFEVEGVANLDRGVELITTDGIIHLADLRAVTQEDGSAFVVGVLGGVREATEDEVLALLDEHGNGPFPRAALAIGLASDVSVDDESNPLYEKGYHAGIGELRREVVSQLREALGLGDTDENVDLMALVRTHAVTVDGIDKEIADAVEAAIAERHLVPASAPEDAGPEPAQPEAPAKASAEAPAE